MYIHREWINVQSQRKKRKKPSYTSPLHFQSWSSIFLGLFPWLLFSSFPFFPCLMWTNVRLKWAKWSVSFPISICEYTVTSTCPTFWKFAKLFFWCHYTLSWYGKMALYTHIHVSTYTPLNVDYNKTHLWKSKFFSGRIIKHRVIDAGLLLKHIYVQQ